jgi:TBC1 domain family member 10
MDAHRQRENKWINVISTIPASTAKKNKRVKKLVQEGVPSSVRFKVWSHLMDSKARKVPGVYSQLGSRPKVPAFGDIERDVRRCFSEHPQLQSTQGPLLSVLQAYLTMVPDIKYTTGKSFLGWGGV